MNYETNALTADDRHYLRTLKHEAQQRLAIFFDGIFGKNTSETVGMSIIVDGKESADMYDHAPGVAYFDREAQVRTPVASCSSIDEAKAQAADWFDELDAHAFAALDNDDEYDGLFRPRRARLMNRAGQEVALFNRNGWFEAYIDPGEFESTRSKIKSLRAEASEERRWDNFDSGQRLEDQAKELELRLEVSTWHRFPF